MTHRYCLYFILLFCTFCWSTGATAFELKLPVGARLTAERMSPIDGFFAPVAPFDGAKVPTVEIEGEITRRAWRIASSGLTPLQVIVPLRDQLLEQGYNLIFDCAAAQCGGFDFRFDIEVLPGPNMYVDISEYRYLTAVLGDPARPEKVVGILASVAAGAAYVQVITADTRAVSATVMPDVEAAPIEVPQAGSYQTGGDLGSLLLAQGFVDLKDLDFGTGTSNLGSGPFEALSELAAFMQDQPDIRIALVGHTDTVGSLEDNVVLSRARAEAVRERLIDQLGIDPDRLEVGGVGYLAPSTTNLTEAGRTLNRRVEAVLLPAPQ